MNIYLHILLGSGRLSPFENEIQDSFDKAVPLITQRIPVKDVDIVIYDNPEGAVKEQGFGGYTPNAHLVYIPMDPSFTDLHNSIRTELKRTLAHELHHALRWHNPGYGETLLDALITEGLADHFDLELFREKPQPWSLALSENRIKKLMEKAQEEFHNKKYDHDAWFYGNEEMNIPRWAGYALGYKIVGDYLEKHPDQKASTLYTAPSDIFLKE